MEVIKDKETGSAELYLSNEEVTALIIALDKNDNEVVSELVNRLWNS